MTHRNDGTQARLGSRAGSTSVLVLVVGLGGFLMAATALALVVGGNEIVAPVETASVLAGEIRDLRSENARLSADLATLENRLEMLETEVAKRPKTIPAAPVAAAADAPAAPVVASGEIGKALESDAGKAAIEATVKDMMEKREQSRFARMMGFDLDTFATENDLTDEQKAKVSDLLGKFGNSMRDLFRGMRRGRPSSEEEREARREEMTKAFETLRTETVQEASSFLQPAQLASFEQQLQMPTGGPGGGFGGGRGGR